MGLSLSLTPSSFPPFLTLLRRDFFWNFTHVDMNRNLSSLVKRFFSEHGQLSRLLFYHEYSYYF
jgi:hypothetical protein